MNGEQFNGIGLAMGVVRGARSFDVDALGRLTGITYKQVWKPGENQAACRKDEHLTNYMSFFLYTETPKEAKLKKIDATKPHDMSDCGHGFYGYYDGSNDYHNRGRVSAVIEGYGETLIGTRGFRCMRAKIVALRIPKGVGPLLRDKILRNYPGIPVFDTFAHMVAEFPPDAAGMEVTPTSDPKFWEREL